MTKELCKLGAVLHEQSLKVFKQEHIKIQIRLVTQFRGQCGRQKTVEKCSLLLVRRTQTRAELVETEVKDVKEVIRVE